MDAKTEVGCVWACVPKADCGAFKPVTPSTPPLPGDENAEFAAGGRTPNADVGCVVEGVPNADVGADGR